MMDEIMILMSAWMFVCALIGVFYGFKNIFFKQKALYMRMIVCGVACQMISRLFGLVFMAVLNMPLPVFNVGILGLIGSFFFFLSANYGQMDALVDDGSKEFIKTRLSALLAPLLLFVIFVFFCLLTEGLQPKIVLGFLTIFIMPCAYYNLKHIIIFDVENGIIEQVRAYNVIVLICGILTILEFVFSTLKLQLPYLIVTFLLGIALAAVLPVLKKGAEKWIRIT